MAKKFYVVWSGRRTGVFHDWATTHPLVDGFAGARYKAFPTEAEAWRAFRTGSDPAADAGPRSKKNQAVTSKSPSKPADPDLEHPTRAAPKGTFDVQIYCDGAADPNPGPAGSGIAVYRNGELRELWYGLYHATGTNNTGELNALYHALLFAEREIAAGKSVQVLSDSKYALNSVALWAEGWEKRGWRRAGGEIKNLELIQALYGLYGRIKAKLELTHVAAHVGTEGNELADRMAMHAVTTREHELRRYEGDMDVKSILRMRAG